MKTILYFIFVSLLMSCRVQTPQNLSDKKYQKKLNRVTKRFIKNTPESVLEDLQGFDVKFDSTSK